MASQEQLMEGMKKAKEASSKKGFTQSYELTITFKDIDIKKHPMNMNEIVSLPHKFSEEPSLCIFASGDLAVRGKRANAERVVEPDELNRLAAEKRNSKKLCKNYTFFLAESSLMSKVGKILGAYLGPRGKMPQPMPPNAPVEAMISRLRQSVRARSRGQLAISCKVGDEKMEPGDVVENALAVIPAIEKKLPMGSRNIRSLVVKLSMGGPVKIVS